MATEQIRILKNLLLKLATLDYRMVCREIMGHRPIKKVFAEKYLKDETTLANDRNAIPALGYSLPTFLIGFPRSGSNFLQSVLQGSSGIRCRSIYGPIRDDSQPILSLKSHAITFEYLMDELRRFTPEVTHPSKLVLLFRDPRDVMISFCEYTQFTKNIQIPQRDFLDKVSFFYAAPIDKGIERRVEYGPLSISDAYKRYIESWFINKPQHLTCLVVKYEGLVTSPHREFKRIFDFLELDCSVAEELLDVKVAQFDEGRVHRGEPGGWRVCQHKYTVLLACVEELLCNEIQALGYE